MQTFQASPEDMKFILSSKNHLAAQNKKCILCGDKWKDHWAGKSKTIPQGACTKDLEVVSESE